MVDELKKHAGIGQDRAQIRCPPQRPTDGARQSLAECKQGDHVQQERRFGPGDDAGAEDIGVGLGAIEHLGEVGLDLCLVGRVGMPAVPSAGSSSVIRSGSSAAEAVGGDRGRVDEAFRTGGDSGREDVARPGAVDLRPLVAVVDDDEGEVDDDVGALDQLRDRLGIADVAGR